MQYKRAKRLLNPREAEEVPLHRQCIRAEILMKSRRDPGSDQRKKI